MDAMNKSFANRDIPDQKIYLRTAAITYAILIPR